MDIRKASDRAMLSLLQDARYRDGVGRRVLARLRHIRSPYRPLAVALDEEKILYFRVTKTASSSITDLLAKHQGLKDESELDFRSDLNLRQYQDYTRFCVVRNPWDRLVSCYKDRFQMTESMHQSGVYLPFLKYNMIPGIPRFRPEMPFDEFVVAVSKIPDRLADMHFSSQDCAVCTRPGVLAVNVVCRFESLKADLERLEEQTRFPFSTIGHRRKRSSSKPYQDYYTDQTRELVAARYQRDIELFSYRFG